MDGKLLLLCFRAFALLPIGLTLLPILIPLMTKTVSLVQINNSFSGQNYLPYSSALLSAYFLQNSSASHEYNFAPFIYKRAPVLDIVNSISSSDVLGLSLYAWNTRLSLGCNHFRLLNPNALIFVGGPSVPDFAESFLRSHPFVDIALHKKANFQLLHYLRRTHLIVIFQCPLCQFYIQQYIRFTPRAPVLTIFQPFHLL